MTDYRERIYARYASMFQDSKPEFDHPAAVRWGRAYDWYLRGWLPARKEAPILELACGFGRLLLFFKDRGYAQVTGVDISPSQTALARQVCERVVEQNVLEYLKRHPGEFEFITALDLIEHLHKDEVLDFLDSCFAALKPGGRLVLQTPNGDAPWGMASRYNDLTHEVCFNSNSLARLLKLTGFDEVSFREAEPVPWKQSLASTVRYGLWKLLRLKMCLWNLVETGASGSGIWTRNFFASAVKPAK